MATCYVLDKSYAEVHAAFKAAGRKNGKGCNSDIQQRAWYTLGYAYEQTEHRLKAKTVVSLGKLLEKTQDTLPLLVYTNSHLMAFVNTAACDYTSDRSHVYRTGRLVKLKLKRKV
jgi:hypothetical protein